MTGPFTVQGSSVTIISSNTADAYSLMITTDPTRLVQHFYLSNTGNLGLMTNAPTHRLTVNGDGLFISSLTVNGGLYTNTINSNVIGLTQGITASSGTFFAFGNNYSVETASGIKVNNYGVEAPYFIGDGSRLTNVLGTDSTKVLKAGDVMTGNMEIRGSSLTVAAYGNNFVYAMTVASSSYNESYSMAVTTSGRTGFKVNNPQSTVHIYKNLTVGSDPGTTTDVDLYLKGGDSYINWGEAVSGFNNKGRMGFVSGTRDLVYTAFPSDTSPGVEALRIYSSGQINFPTTVNFSTSANSSTLFISTTTGMVSVGTTTIYNRLGVNGGITALSSVTAYGGYYGDPAGNMSLNGTSMQLNASNLYLNANSIYSTGTLSVGGDNSLGSARMEIIEKGSESFTLAVGSNTSFTTPTYDMVVTTSGRVGIGIPNSTTEPTAQLQVMGGIRVGADGYGDSNAYVHLRPIGGDSYIIFESQTKPNIAVMGTRDNVTPQYFTFKINANKLSSGGSEVYRINTNGQFGIYASVPEAALHIGANMLVSTATVTPILYVSTDTAMVGIGTLSASHKLHVSGNAIVTSSMSVSGIGISGAAPVFQVVGGTFTVLANGNIGIGTNSPSTKLSVEGSAAFGSGATKSTFTAAGYFKPVWLDSVSLAAISPSEIGLIVGNITNYNLCVSTATVVGAWAAINSGGTGQCY